MTAKQLYNGLALGDISLSNALAIIRAELPLTEIELDWVNSELEGYKDKGTVPEYRQLPCQLLACLVHTPTGKTYKQEIQGEGIAKLDKMLEEHLGLSIYKIYVTQGIEQIEGQFQRKPQGSVVMKLEGPPRQMMIEAIQPYVFPSMHQVRDVVQSSDTVYIDRALFAIKQTLSKILLKYIQQDNSSVLNRDINDSQSKGTIFISYCWENEEHEKWVEKFAKDLQRYI